MQYRAFALALLLGADVSSAIKVSAGKPESVIPSSTLPASSTAVTKTHSSTTGIPSATSEVVHAVDKTDARAENAGKISDRSVDKKSSDKSFDKSTDKSAGKKSDYETTGYEATDKTADKKSTEKLKSSEKNVDSEVHKPNGANKQSPHANSLFESHHKPGTEEVYHAPKIAPNEEQLETEKSIDGKEEKDEDKKGKKGKKGAVVLDDYNPDRLGVNADVAKKEEKSKDSKDSKAKDSDDKDSTKGKTAKGFKESPNKKDAPEDSKPKEKETEKESKVTKGSNPIEDNKSKENINISEKSKHAADSKANAKADPKLDSKVDSKVAPKVDDEKKPLKDTADSSAKSVKSPEESEKESSTTTAKGKSKFEGYPSRDEISRGQTDEELNQAKFGRFLGSAIMIVVSEIGDKTFFIAALMAMRHPSVFVFSSSYSAMVVMTVLSMILGLVLPSLLSRKVTTLLAALLFVVFGVRMVMEAWSMDKNLAATDEMEEVENDLAMHDSSNAMEKAEGGGLTSDDSPASKLHQKKVQDILSLVLSPVWIQIFAMTFLGEWGDRSQIATVAMGAGEGWFEVLFGCLLGHFISTVIAVLGGKILAQHLSLRTITFSGALCFLLFGVFYFNDWLHEA